MSDFLAEHCAAPGCADGYVTLWVDGIKQISRCVVCAGTTRRIRHRFDQRSAIDPPTTEEATLARLHALVRSTPNDSELGAAVRALLNAAP